jgi:hypothetical protein
MKSEQPFSNRDDFDPQYFDDQSHWNTRINTIIRLPSKAVPGQFKRFRSWFGIAISFIRAVPLKSNTLHFPTQQSLSHTAMPFCWERSTTSLGHFHDHPVSVHPQGGRRASAADGARALADTIAVKPRGTVDWGDRRNGR